MDFYTPTFGFWVPMIISLAIVFCYPRLFLRTAMELRLFIFLTPIINFVYFWFQEANGWDSAKGVHLIPVVFFSLIYFLSDSKKKIIRRMSPITSYAVCWSSLVAMDVIGAWLFNLSSKTKEMHGKIVIGAEGIKDALFIGPFLFSFALAVLPLILEVATKIPKLRKKL